MRGLFKILDDSGESIQVELPMQWVICYDCLGEGKSSAHLGAITSSEFSEWDFEERDAYFLGRYDKLCSGCKGSGKMRVVDEEACTGLVDAENLKRFNSDREAEAEYRAESEAERRMGC